MLKKSNLFAFLLMSAFGTAAYAQDTTIVPAAPSQPQQIERQLQIFTNGGGSYLGVQLQEVGKDNFGKFGLKDVRGVAVEKVSENSPAKQAGLQDGDVIVRFDGEDVSSVRKLQRLIGEVAPDHQSKVTILRGGDEKNLTVTVGKRPAASFQNGAFATVPGENTFEYSIPAMPEFPSKTMPAPPNGANEMFRIYSNPNGDNMMWNLYSGRRIGINTMPLTKQLGDYFGTAEGKGILVSSVSENSPAAKAGIKAGDVILEADGNAVSSPAQLTKALGDKQKKTVNLTVLRNKNRQNITVEPQELPAPSNTQQQLRVIPRTMRLAAPTVNEL